MKEKENSYLNTYKEHVDILKYRSSYQQLDARKHKSKRAHSRTRVTTTLRTFAPIATAHLLWRAPRHVFQARATSRNSTKYRAVDLRGNLICEYFCWMHGDPHFFSADHFLSDSFHYTNRQKKSVRGKF